MKLEELSEKDCSWETIFSLKIIRIIYKYLESCVYMNRKLFNFYFILKYISNIYIIYTVYSKKNVYS